MREIVAALEHEVGFYQALFDACTVMMEAIHRVPNRSSPRSGAWLQQPAASWWPRATSSWRRRQARLATPGVKIGLFCSTPMVPVSRAVGRKRAMEMLLTGDFVDARTALAWGLVNHVVPEEQLDRAVDDLVAKIARSSPLTVGIGKAAFYPQIELDEHRTYDLTKAVMTMNSMAADAQEGICAFLAKRQPKWKGR